MEHKKQYLTIGNILGETINFYTKNFFILWLPYILIAVPASLLTQYIQTYMFTSRFFNFIFIVLNAAITTAVGLYVLISILNLYKNKTHSFADTWDKVKTIFFPYILLQLVIFLGILGGFILLVVPGVIFSLRWVTASVIFIDEELKIRESMKRSRLLVKGYKGQIFISYLLIVIIGLVIYALTTRLVGNYSGLMDSIARNSLNPFNISSISYAMLSSFVSPLYPSMLAAIYYSLKKEKEGFETEQLADSFLENNDIEKD